MNYQVMLRVVISWSILVLGSPTLLAQEQQLPTEVYIDQDCSRTEQLSQLEKYTVFYQSEFEAANTIYWFYAGRYQDGAVLFCISERDFDQPRVLNEKQLQYQFIDRITASQDNPSVFLITVVMGNGINAPVIDYQLDLSNVSQPVLTLLESASQ